MKTDQFKISITALVLLGGFNIGLGQFTLPATFGTGYNNQTVTLTGNLSANSQINEGIQIWATNFTIDGTYHSIEGVRTGQGDHVGVKMRDKAPNITILNLEIHDWGQGITGRQWVDGVIDSCFVHHNKGHGFKSSQEDNLNCIIKNSTFSDNTIRGIILSSTVKYHIYNNLVADNGYNNDRDDDFDKDTRGGGIEVTHAVGDSNIIEHNTISGNYEWGLRLGAPLDNAEVGAPKRTFVLNNTFINNSIIIDHSDSNTFIGNTLDGATSTITVSGGSGNILEDFQFAGFTALNLTVDDGAKVALVGTPLGAAVINVIDAGTELAVMWHVDALITQDDTPLEGASVSFYDNDNNLVAVNTTDSLGHIDTLDLVEYVETIDGKAYLAPYTVVVEQGGVELYTGSYAIDGNTTVTMTQVAVTGNESYHPAAFRLDQNYPNPFNPETVISYEVGELTATSLRIYDIRGRLVRTLFTAYKIPGRYERTWDGTDGAGLPVSSGIYIYSLSGGGEVINRRMVLLR